MLDAFDAPRVERSQARRREVGYTFAGLALLSLGMALNLDRIHAEPLDVDAPVAARLAVIYAGVPDLESPDAPPPPPPAGRAAGAPLAGAPHSALAETFAEGMLRELERPEEADAASGGFVRTQRDRLSTFSIDVDTAGYSRIRERIEHDIPIDPEQVRVEEMINYFDYALPQPAGDAPLSLHAEVGPCPWEPTHRLARVALKAKDTPPPRAGRNLVYLIDTSGSMQGALEDVTRGLMALTEVLGVEDRVSIVTYAGDAGVVLPPTAGNEHATIAKALRRLRAGGGTNGSGGIEVAYALAEASFVEGGINRVVLATDGDFNVGVADHDALVKLIERKRETGVFLSVLGFDVYGADELLEQLADHGNGNYAYIDGPAEAQRVLVEDADATLVTVARDVKVQVEFDPSRVARHRLAGYLNRRLEHRDFHDDAKDAGELGSGQTVTALYELVPTDNADDEGPWLSVRTRYKPMDAGPSQSRATKVWRLRAPSRDFRWAAAVAWFGRLLATEAPVHDERWTRAYGLAANAVGDDPSGRRCEMLGLMALASDGAVGDDVPGRCRVLREREPPELPEPSERPPVETSAVEDPSNVPDELPAPESVEPESEDPDAPPAWLSFVWNTIRLLPPLLALPMFVLAYRAPRRPRSEK